MRPRIPKQQIDLLKAVPLFSGCSQGELRAVAQLGTPVSVAKGEVLTEQGSAGREFFLVLSGVASCRVKKRQIAQFTTGGYFGELALCTGASGRPMSLRRPTWSCWCSTPANSARC